MSDEPLGPVLDAEAMRAWLHGTHRQTPRSLPPRPQDPDVLHQLRRRVARNRSRLAALPAHQRAALTPRPAGHLGWPSTARVAAPQPTPTSAHAAQQASDPDDGSSGSGPQAVHPSVLRMRQVGANRSVEDAELIVATAAMVDAVRHAVLVRRGLDPAGLGKTKEASVEQEVRNLAVAELQLAIGLGLTEARTLVTAAMSPADLAVVIDTALRTGYTSWPLVRRFLDQTTTLSAEQRLLVALALFGTDPALAHEDRLDPDGNLRDEPWGHARFAAALEGEVTACESTDPESERARRTKAYQRRRMTVKVHDDGTATLRVTGPAAAVVGAYQRHDRSARNLRKAGDPRTLDQLRFDSAGATLLYATITLPGTSTVNPAPTVDDQEPAPADEQHTTEPSAAQQHNAAPTDDPLTGDPGDGGHPAEDEGDAPTAGHHDEAGGGGGVDQEGLFDETLAPDDIEHIARVLNALPLVQLQVVVPYSALSGGFPLCAHCSRPSADPDPPPTDPPQHGQPPRGPGQDSAHPEPSPSTGRRGRGRVAEVLGPHPFFITDGHARELALLPGTTLHRLVVDPRDGRLVERTIRTYRPDADMRRQVIAADVFSRAPGSRLGAHAGELDHVTPYGWAGGPTSETNLALLAKRPHQFKTDGAWDILINPRRDLSITTVLGQVVTTRTHDYRTYLRTAHPDDLDARRDLANRLVYAALAQHPARRDPDRTGTRPGDRVSLDWTSPTTGATYTGPSPGHPTLDDLLRDVSGHASDGDGDGDGVRTSSNASGAASNDDPDPDADPGETR